MKKSRLPNELSLEELLKVASTEESEEEVYDKEVASIEDSYISFFQAFDIRPGKEPVSGLLLLELFHKWLPGTKTKQRTFYLILNKYLPRERRSIDRLYLIDQDFIKIKKHLEDIKRGKRFNRTKSSKWHEHTQKFLQQTGLDKGDLWVEADILYYIYNRWIDACRRKNPLGYETFKRFCKLIFPVKQANSELPWFAVNHKLEELITKEEIIRWREGRLRHAKRSKSKKEKVST